MPKYFVIILSIFLLFIVAFTAVGAFLIYDQTRPTSSIGVTDTIKQKVKPDQANVQLFISQSGTDVKRMNAENDIATVKVTDFLFKQGIDKNKIKTNKNSFEEYFDKDIETAINPSSSAKKNMRVETIIDVEFTNLDNNPNKILDETLNLGVTNYGSFNYKIKDVKVVCDQLEKDVEKTVKIKAEQKISNIGAKIIKTQYNQTYVTGCDNNIMPLYNAKSLDSGITSDVPDLMTGEQEVSATASLNVEYR